MCDYAYDQGQWSVARSKESKYTLIICWATRRLILEATIGAVATFESYGAVVSIAGWYAGVTTASTQSEEHEWMSQSSSADR